MGLNAIALAHLRRHLGKSVLVVVGLATAVAAFVAVMSLIVSLRSTMDDRLAKFGAGLTVTPPSPELTLSYGGVVVATAGTAQPASLDGGTVAKIQAIPSSSRLAAVIPVLLKPVVISGEQYLAMGTEVADSARLRPWWHVQGALPAEGEVLLGLNARNKLAVEPGDTVSIEGRDLTVSGVLLATGGEEDNAVIMDRDVLVSLTNAGTSINLVEVTAADSREVERVAEEIQRAVPGATVSTIKKSLEFNSQAASSLAQIGAACSALIALVAVFVVVLTMLAAVRERQKEIGVLRAVGFLQKHIMSLVFRESLLLSLVAAVVGVGLGVVGAVVGPRLVPGMSLDFRVAPWVLVGGCVLSLALAAVATVYPALRAARLDPALALKKL